MGIGLFSGASITDVTELTGYEQGTFTPTIQDATLSDAEGQTYSTQNGYYTKIGNLVHCNGRIVSTSIGTLTTSEGVRLGGLPFAVSSDANNNSCGSLTQASSLSITAGVAVFPRLPAASSVARFDAWDATGGTSDFLLSEYTADGRFTFNFSYQTDA